MSFELFSTQPELLKVITDSLSSTIANFTQVRAVAGPMQPKSERVAFKCDAGAAIRFEGPRVSMELLIVFPQDLIFQLCEIFFQTISADLLAAQDLAGEILNISFGTIDPTLSGKGIKLKSSFPHKFSGAPLQELLKKVSEKTLFVPYTAAGKSFYLEIHKADTLPLDWKYTPKK